MINSKIKKAISFMQNGSLNEAEELLLSLYQKDPQNHTLLSYIGLFYVKKSDYNNAVIFLKQACDIKKTLGTLSALGFAKYELKEYKEAAEILEKSLKLGENIEIYDKLILSLFNINDCKKAIEYANIMHEKYPENTIAIANLVKSYIHSGKLLEAEKLCVETLKNNHNSPALWFNLGYLKELIYADDASACKCYKVALDLGNKGAYYNIAVSYHKQGNFIKAEEYYQKMLDYFPNDTNTLSSYGMCKLAQKKFHEGYSLFFNRDKTFLDSKINNPWEIGDEWDDEVVVICDQGFGDHIQFIRYLPFLKEKVKKLQVASHKSLIKLFSNNYQDIKFIPYSEIDPKMQSIKITDLAFALNIDFDNIPFSAGYLDSEKLEIKNEKLKVGLCWEAGNAGIRSMINRTINIKLFEGILNLNNIQVYSFQVRDTLKGNKKYADKMVNLTTDFQNFYDTAKAMKAMDLIISVDTSVAHLAGALGIKTFLLLPYITDWRWFEDTKTTPWYDSIQIFKQNDTISWEKPFEDIICKLKEFSL